MKIPEIINSNTLKAYLPSNDCLKLVGEDLRQLCSEDFSWDLHMCPTLRELCVNVIRSKFEETPMLDELLCEDRQYLVQGLTAQLSLEKGIPHLEVNAGRYWKRKYESKYNPLQLEHTLRNLNWKQRFVELHVNELIENAQPQHKDEEGMADSFTLCSSYVKNLHIEQLQPWEPPLCWDAEDIPEKYPIEHIDFGPVFQHLNQIESINLIFSLKQTVEKFKWDFFDFSVLDCQKFGRSLQHLSNLKILTIHRSLLNDEHVYALVPGLTKNCTELEELSIRYCLISDRGVACLSEFVQGQKKLRKLDLSGNNITSVGGSNLGAMLSKSNCRLQCLVLNLNPLETAGISRIIVGTIRSKNLKQLSINATQFDEQCSKYLGSLVKYNKYLTNIDISNNSLGERGGQMLLKGLKDNKTLQWLDIRKCGISPKIEKQIKKVLLVNRSTMNKTKDLNEIINAYIII